MKWAHDCPDDQTLRDFSEQRLGEAASREIEIHLTRCHSCTTRLSQLARADDEDFKWKSIQTRQTRCERTPAAGDEATIAGDAIDDADFDLSVLTPSEFPDSVGRLLNYEILHTLGRGGMGIVFHGFDSKLERPVAVKVIARQLASSPNARRRFLREARAAAAIKHPNVVTIYAVDEYKGHLFLVMEYVNGQPLSKRIAAEAPMSHLEIASIGAQIAAGLAAAHARGIIHRDIKPGNVIVEEMTQLAKIADFGLARVLSEDSALTEGVAMGTPAYMSPEQVAGTTVDERTDLFSLGCVLHAMVTGNSPFSGDNPAEIVHKISTLNPPTLSSVKSEIPDSISTITARLMAKRPGDRYASALEVAHLLAPPGLSIVTPAAGLPAVARSKRPAVLWILSGVFLLAILAVVVLFASLRPNGDGGPSTPGTITVAQSGNADHRSISDALRRATSGTTIEVLDDATYDGPINFYDALRWANVTLQSAKGATLQASEGYFVVKISKTPGVVIRGFRLNCAVDQHGVMITGAASGVSIEDVHIDAPAVSQWAAVYITSAALGAKESPIQIRDSEFSGGTLGIIVEGDYQAAVSWIEIAGNRFVGTGSHLQLNDKVSNIRVEHNRFFDGTAITLNLRDAADVLISNNSFLAARPWLDLGRSDALCEGIVISNNLILRPSSIANDETSLSSFVTNWAFRNNLWEGDVDDSNFAVMQMVAVPRPSVQLVSRNPNDDDFLRPLKNPTPAGTEIVPYIGALAPADFKHDSSPETINGNPP
jgi:serine/threonine protein kinase